MSFHLQFRGKGNNGRAYKTLIGFLLAGFVFAQIYTCSSFISNFVLVKFGLVVSLPGGLLEQAAAANSQISMVVAFVLNAISGNFVVSSESNFTLILTAEQ